VFQLSRFECLVYLYKDFRDGFAVDIVIGQIGLGNVFIT
jgi:hypothetical protein